MIIKKLLAIVSSVFLIMSINANAEVMSPDSKDNVSGIVMFAKLDNAIDRVHPDHLIKATVLDGKYKNATLYGKLSGSTNKSNQFSLLFTKIRYHGQVKQQNITAYAIDAATAQTALANKVDTAYLRKNAVILSGSFLEEYSTLNATDVSYARIGILFNR